MPRPPVAPHFPFRFPITAIASIAHRITGVALVVAAGLGLWLLALAKASPQGYGTATAALDHWLGATILWLALVGLTYHVLNAVRHTCQDFGLWVEKGSGAFTAAAVFAATGLAGLALGLWLLS